ncbi:MAG: phosphatase PAP2 family protein [Dehalococcoidia bacterium]|nr:phosphatase PAP2 family protein [Dehalococcoidia bacterium]
MEYPSSLAESLLLAALAGATFWLLRPAGLSFAVLAPAAGFAGFVIVGHEGFPVAVAAFALVARLAMQFHLHRPRQPLWLSFARELFFIGAALSLYTGARVLIEGEFVDAHANALRILDVEAALGLGFETDLQSLVLRNEPFVRFLDTVYSFYFLPFVGCTLLWLFLFHPAHYRLMRNALGVSVVLAVVTIVLLPVAPPRLVPESGMIDTIALSGREHSFSNEYAAVPSLHVGWMFLSGFVLALTVEGRWRYLLALAPGAFMLFTVIATGNHYWLDGAVGALYSVGPALFLFTSRHPKKARVATGPELGRRAALAVHGCVQRLLEFVGASPRALFSTASLGSLLLFLVVGEIVAPGFTAFWGYLLVQMAATLVLLLTGETFFRGQGGLSWQTHLIAVACGYADTLGTAGNLYANLAEYDKITHFAGVAAVTAAAYDCLRALDRRGNTSAWVASRFWTAIGIGIAAGIGWEVYEALADDIFATKRVQGRIDTTYDLLFDSLGAFVAAFLVRWAERREAEEEPGLSHEHVS